MPQGKLKDVVSSLRSHPESARLHLLTRLVQRLARRRAPNPSPVDPACVLKRDDVVIRLIDVGANVARVDMLVAKMYGQRGYQTDSPPSPTKQNFNVGAPRRVTLEASRENRTVGTITVALDGEGALNAEDLYRDEILPFRARGARLCEFTRLALDMDQCGKEALGSLFHLAVMFAYKVHDATDLFIEVNPRHSLFYRRKLGFAVVGEEKVCRRVNAPAVLLHQKLASISEQIIRYGGLKTHQNKSFYAFFMPPWEERELLAELRSRLSNLPQDPYEVDIAAA